MRGQLPTLDTGVTFLDDDDAPAALYRLVGHQLAETDGAAYWVDARNAASPDALYRHVPARARRRLRVARAFTCVQHFELVRSLPGEVSAGTSLVVAPNLASLYAAGDLPDDESEATFDATLELLSALAGAVDASVLVTASARRERVRAAADRTMRAEATRVGLRVDGRSFETDVYVDDWGFQTTIPYWVDLLGAVEADGEPTLADPVAPGV